MGQLKSHIRNLWRVWLTSASNAELTESVKDGLDKLAGNFGIDVPDSIGDVLPYVVEVVLGFKLIRSMVATEAESYSDVELNKG